MLAGAAIITRSTPRRRYRCGSSILEMQSKAQHIKVWELDPGSAVQGAAHLGVGA